MNLVILETQKSSLSGHALAKKFISMTQQIKNVSFLLFSFFLIVNLLYFLWFPVLFLVLCTFFYTKIHHHSFLMHLLYTMSSINCTRKLYTHPTQVTNESTLLIVVCTVPFFTDSLLTPSKELHYNYARASSLWMLQTYIEISLKKTLFKLLKVTAKNTSLQALYLISTISGKR